MFQTRLTEEEARRVREYAGECGMTYSELVRLLLAMQMVRPATETSPSSTFTRMGVAL